jgi:ankyrin repeat protein
MIGKHQKVAELLLERGADPNVQDGNNNTPLHLALQSGLVERAELLARGTDSNARDNDNTIPLPWSS